MHRLPQVFRKSTTQSLKPKKQGGIFQINLVNTQELQYASIRCTSSFSKRSLVTTADRTLRSRDGRLTQRSSRKSEIYQQKIIQCLQADSLRVLGEKIDDQRMNVEKQLTESSIQINNIKQQLMNLCYNKQQQLNQIQLKCSEYFHNIRKILSTSRRQTGMQIKVLAKQANKMSQQLIETCNIMKDFEHRIKCFQVQVLDKK